MCTVSWTAARDGYDLFFNRDELNTRAPEEPPTRAHRNGIAYLAPRDGDHGGTWLAANEFGVTICLLNDYAAPWRPPEGLPRMSRGHLVRAGADAATHAEVMHAMRAQPLERTMPFHLVALSPEEGALILSWRGGDLMRQAEGKFAVPPLSSSSFATENVIAARLRRFGSFLRACEPAVAELAAYHRQHDRGAGAYSVLMCRDDAATRSICHVAVNARHVRLRYQPVQWIAREPTIVTTTESILVRRPMVGTSLRDVRELPV
jgi:hypothetical protein